MGFKISIVVPIYNVEQYLHQCINSILNQSFNNFELLLINDGSTDNSGKICDEYAKKDLRIKVIHQKNSGVSVARNKGIDMATGEYIGFVDPDDYIDSRMYEILVNKIEEMKADIAICSFSFVKNDEVISHDNGNECKVFNKEKSIEYYFKEKLPFDYSFLCNKLFRRGLFDTIRLNAFLSVQEDSEVLIRILNCCSSIIYVSEALYFYYIRVDSLTHSRLTLKQLSVVDSLYEIYDYVQKNLPQFSNYALNKYLLYYFNQVIEMVKEGKTFNEQYFVFRKKLYKNYFSIIFNPSVAFKYKIHSTVYILVPSIYRSYLKNRLRLKGDIVLYEAK